MLKKKVWKDESTEDSSKLLTSELYSDTLTKNHLEDSRLARESTKITMEKKYATVSANSEMKRFKASHRHLTRDMTRIESKLKPEEIRKFQLEEENEHKAKSHRHIVRIKTPARRPLRVYNESARLTRTSSTQCFAPYKTEPLLAKRTFLENNRCISVNNTRRDLTHETGAHAQITSSVLDFKKSKHPIFQVESRSSQVNAPSIGNKTTTSLPILTVRKASTAGIKPVTEEKRLLPPKSARSPSRSPAFSSHAIAVGDQLRPAAVSPAASSIWSVDSNPKDILPSINTAQLAEQRQKDTDQNKQLEQKKHAFMKRMDSFVEKSKPKDRILKKQESVQEMDLALLKERFRRIRKARRSITLERTFTTEDDYKQKGADLWKDVNKARYLRTRDSQLDLSGIVTLASEQMSLRNNLTSFS